MIFHRIYKSFHIPSQRVLHSLRSLFQLQFSKRTTSVSIVSVSIFHKAEPFVRFFHSTTTTTTRAWSILLDEEDFNLNLELFYAKIAPLTPLQQTTCLTEYYKRQKPLLELEYQQLVSEQEQQLASDDTSEEYKENIRLRAKVIKYAHRSKLWNDIQLLAHGAIFDFIQTLPCVPMGNQTCPRETIVELWRQCRDLDEIPDIVDAASHISKVEDEKEEEQHVLVMAFQRVVQTITCGVEHHKSYSSSSSSSSSSRNCQRKLQPDIVLAKRGITHPGYHDVLALIQVQSPTIHLQDAVEPVSKYLSEHATFRQSRISLNTLIAIGTNWKEVCIFGFANNIHDSVTDLYLYKIAECFPVGWKRRDDPTDGFIQLCHAIHQTGKSNSKYIQIHGSKVVITGTIYKGKSGIGIYRCNYQNQELAIKQAIEKRGQDFMIMELHKLIVVSNITDFHPYLLPWRQYLPIQYGYAMHVGTVITDPSILTENDFLEETYRWMIQGLRILHSHDLYHMDIRPGNIIIYQNTARLVDWLTLQNGDTENAYYRLGHEDPFWPFHREKFTEKSLFYLWDLISLGYTFLFLTVKNLAIRLEMQTNRFDVVNKLSTDPTFVGKMARIIQYLETTSDTDKDMLYEKCLKEIKKS